MSRFFRISVYLAGVLALSCQPGAERQTATAVKDDTVPGRDADVSEHEGADDLAVVDESEGQESGRLHLPRLLHRPVPGKGAGDVCAAEAESEDGGDPARQQERLLGWTGRGVQDAVHGVGRTDRGGAELQRR